MLSDNLKLQPIARIAPPDNATFQREYVDRGLPVILVQAAASWPCVNQWSLDYIEKRCGANPITLRHIDSTADRTSSKATNMASYLNSIRRDTYCPEYLSEVPLSVAMPQLTDEVPSDPYTGITSSATTVMLGARTYAACHYHTLSEAISTQVVGRRRFVLFAPDQRAYLYPRKFWHRSRLRNFSYIDFLHGDLASWPLLQQAQGYEGILAPGDSIYIPVHWWHTVFSLDRLSVLLVRFFTASWRRYHYPRPGLSLLARHVLPSAGKHVVQQLRTKVINR